MYCKMYGVVVFEEGSLISVRQLWPPTADIDSEKQFLLPILLRLSLRKTFWEFTKLDFSVWHSEISDTQKN